MHSLKKVCIQKNANFLFLYMLINFELYEQIKIGLDDIESGNTRPFNEVMADVKRTVGCQFFVVVFRFHKKFYVQIGIKESKNPLV